MAVIEELTISEANNDDFKKLSGRLGGAPQHALQELGATVVRGGGGWPGSRSGTRPGSVWRRCSKWRRVWSSRNAIV